MPVTDQRLVVVQRVEIVEPRGLADIGHHDHAQTQPFRRARRARHEAPHVHRGRRAGQQTFAIAQPGRDLGVMRAQHAVHRIDVQAQPVPQRHALRGAAQEAGMAMRVDQAGHQHGAAQILALRVRRADGNVRDRADCDDLVVAYQHGAVGDDAVLRIHRQDGVRRQHDFLHGVSALLVGLGQVMPDACQGAGAGQGGWHAPCVTIVADRHKGHCRCGYRTARITGSRAAARLCPPRTSSISAAPRAASKPSPTG